MSIKVCIAGATGWAGSELSRGIAATDDLDLVAAVARQHAGQALGAVLDEPALTAPIFASVDAALAQPCDVFVEYTRPASAKANILAALEHGAHVVVGTSGLTDEDYAQIDALAAIHEARLAPKPAWTRAKMDDKAFDAMLRGITGFALRIQAWRGTRKINQNKPDAARLAAADALTASGRPAIAHWMRNPS